MPEDNAALLTPELVPQEYQGLEYVKPWLGKPIKEAIPEVFKKLVNAETLIGKRPPLPTRDSKPEELQKFFDTLRPDKAEEYEIPTEKDAKRDEAFMKVVQKAFHAGSISKLQAQKFLETFLPDLKGYGAEQRKALETANAKKAQEFDLLAKTMLGEQNKETMARVKKLIAEHAPSVAKANIDKLSDENLVLMAAVIDPIVRKYMSEDDLKAMSVNGGATEATLADKRAEAMKILGSKEYTDEFHPDHARAVRRKDEIYAELAKAGVKV